jgi:hypothetical protein
MVGAEVGLLKVLFHPKTLKVLGVHAIGDGATEIIHIGQAVLAFGGTIEYFRDTVFNYPTFAEAYKVAGLDGLYGKARVREPTVELTDHCAASNPRPLRSHVSPVQSTDSAPAGWLNIPGPSRTEM